MLTYVRGAAVSAAAARARAPQLSGSVRDFAGAAAAAGVPHSNAPDFEEMARKWFDAWLPAATDQLRPTLIKEALEHLRRARRSFAVLFAFILLLTIFVAIFCRGRRP